MAPICKIILDNPYNTYFAGQTISGKVEVTLDKPKKIKGILLHIKGAAKVRWTERSSSSRGSRTVRYYNDELYFETKHYAVGGGYNEEITLPLGKSIYNFSFPLPLNVPSSFEGPYGNIRHTIEAIIERPWKWNLNTKVVFTVISHYDLNMFPNLLTAAKVNADKYFCCWCCKNGPLTVAMQIPKSGFVSGERMPITVEVDNLSNIVIENVKLKFQQFTSFYAKFPSSKIRQDAVIFEEMRLGQVDKRGSKTWTQMLLIPPLPPTSVNECSIMDSEYQIYLEVVPQGCHVSLKASIPVIIGTVPFIERDNSLPPQYDTIAGNEAGKSQIGWNETSGSPIPMQTFSESRHFNTQTIDDVDEEDETSNNNSKNFKPVYPTYDFKYQ